MKKTRAALGLFALLMILPLGLSSCWLPILLWPSNTYSPAPSTTATPLPFPSESPQPTSLDYNSQSAQQLRSNARLFSEPVQSGYYSMQLENLPQDASVWFIFTNPSSSTSVSAPRVERVLSGSRSLGDTQEAAESYAAPERTTNDGSAPLRGQRLERPAILRERELEAAGGLAEQITGARSTGKLYAEEVTVPTYTLGDTFTLVDEKSTDNTSYTIPLTLKAMREQVATEQGERSLYVWLDPAWYHDGTGPRSGRVDDAMLQVVLDRFLQEDDVPGVGNDIYDYVSNLLGPEWGAHSSTSQIPFTGQIHILLFNIDDDESTNGGILGFFWARHNYLAENQSGSAEKILFCLDAPMFAAADSNSWEETDYWPSLAISTLAHEFQHMIHYYQRSVIGAGTHSTWLNELMSMAIEDVVADKLKIPGPRGVPLNGESYNLLSGTELPDSYGRLNYFNYYNDIPLSGYWINATQRWQSMASYGISYAFGSWLCRAYGPENVLGRLMSSTSKDRAAVLAVVNELSGGTLSWNELSRLWTAETLLSDQAVSSEVGAEERGYNSGNGSFTLSSGTEYGADNSYRLGDINLFNYALDPGAYTDSLTITAPVYGPWIYPNGSTISKIWDYTVNKDSNAIFRLTDNAATTEEFLLYLPTGLELGILVRE
jgi:hypothetical protein